VYGIVCLLKAEPNVYDCSLILSENMTFDEAINKVTSKVAEELE